MSRNNEGENMKYHDYQEKSDRRVGSFLVSIAKFILTVGLIFYLFYYILFGTATFIMSGDISMVAHRIQNYTVTQCIDSGHNFIGGYCHP